jgi:hypothetical protein
MLDSKSELSEARKFHSPCRFLRLYFLVLMLKAYVCPILGEPLASKDLVTSEGGYKDLSRKTVAWNWGNPEDFGSANHQSTQIPLVCVLYGLQVISSSQ